ncbi:uncharacterized protein [Parasteatoda tepidariorum]|nr:uncharacterized protein LOC107445104 isoform X2 [Parasteatoda tepidariorum]XP_042899765.1 uncharacterized protein LOC107445104 isoform X2 [Parasteatoda tepidariorum]
MKKPLMHFCSKFLMTFQLVCCLVIVCLILHAGSYDRTYFGVAPTTMCLLLISASHLFLNSIILPVAYKSERIYETPLICFQSVIFFILLNIIGVLAIVKNRNFESLEEKEIGIAGALAILTAFASTMKCCTSYEVCKNMRSL